MNLSAEVISALANVADKHMNYTQNKSSGDYRSTSAADLYASKPRAEDSTRKQAFTRSTVGKIGMMKDFKPKQRSVGIGIVQQEESYVCKVQDDGHSIKMSFFKSPPKVNRKDMPNDQLDRVLKSPPKVSRKDMPNEKLDQVQPQLTPSKKKNHLVLPGQKLKKTLTEQYQTSDTETKLIGSKLQSENTDIGADHDIDDMTFKDVSGIMLEKDAHIERSEAIWPETVINKPIMTLPAQLQTSTDKPIATFSTQSPISAADKPIITLTAQLQTSIDKPIKTSSTKLLISADKPVTPSTAQPAVLADKHMSTSTIQPGEIGDIPVTNSSTHPQASNNEQVSLSSTQGAKFADSSISTSAIQLQKCADDIAITTSIQQPQAFADTPVGLSSEQLTKLGDQPLSTLLALPQKSIDVDEPGVIFTPKPQRFADEIITSSAAKQQSADTCTTFTGEPQKFADEPSRTSTPKPQDFTDNATSTPKPKDLTDNAIPTSVTHPQKSDKPLTPIAAHPEPSIIKPVTMPAAQTHMFMDKNVEMPTQVTEDVSSEKVCTAMGIISQEHSFHALTQSPATQTSTAAAASDSVAESQKAKQVPKDLPNLFGTAAKASKAVSPLLRCHSTTSTDSSNTAVVSSSSKGNQKVKELPENSHGSLGMVSSDRNTHTLQKSDAEPVTTLVVRIQSIPKSPPSSVEHELPPNTTNLRSSDVESHLMSITATQTDDPVLDSLSLEASGSVGDSISVSSSVLDSDPEFVIWDEIKRSTPSIEEEVTNSSTKETLNKTADDNDGVSDQKGNSGVSFSQTDEWVVVESISEVESELNDSIAEKIEKALSQEYLTPHKPSIDGTVKSGEDKTHRLTEGADKVANVEWVETIPEGSDTESTAKEDAVSTVLHKDNTSVTTSGRKIEVIAKSGESETTKKPKPKVVSTLKAKPTNKSTAGSKTIETSSQNVKKATVKASGNKTAPKTAVKVTGNKTIRKTTVKPSAGKTTQKTAVKVSGKTAVKTGAVSKGTATKKVVTKAKVKSASTSEVEKGVKKGAAVDNKTSSGAVKSNKVSSVSTSAKKETSKASTSGNNKQSTNVTSVKETDVGIRASESSQQQNSTKDDGKVGGGKAQSQKAESRVAERNHPYQRKKKQSNQPYLSQHLVVPELHELMQNFTNKSYISRRQNRVTITKENFFQKTEEGPGRFKDMGETVCSGVTIKLNEKKYDTNVQKDSAQQRRSRVEALEERLNRIPARRRVTSRDYNMDSQFYEQVSPSPCTFKFMVVTSRKNIAM